MLSPVRPPQAQQRWHPRHAAECRPARAGDSAARPAPGPAPLPVTRARVHTAQASPPIAPAGRLPTAHVPQRRRTQRWQAILTTLTFDRKSLFTRLNSCCLSISAKSTRRDSTSGGACKICRTQVPVSLHPITDPPPLAQDSEHSQRRCRLQLSCARAESTVGGGGGGIQGN